MTNPSKQILFSVWLVLLIAANGKFLAELFLYAYKSDFASHILLIPFIVAWLIFQKRGDLLAQMDWFPLGGGILLAFGIAVLIISGMVQTQLSYNDYLSTRAFSLVVLVIGLFLLFYGAKSSRVALFPILFLLLMVPLPDYILQNTIGFLVKGSAEATAIAFKLTGTPFYREGFTFHLPGASIEIAPQCSGIRSSLALLITILLAAHLVLRSTWRKLLIILVVVPAVMVKNAVRIVALSLLGIHVDMKFLTESSLHTQGGILFFLLILLLLFPLLWVLQKSEQEGGSGSEPPIEGKAQTNIPVK